MTQKTFKTYWFRNLYLMWLFSVFNQHQKLTFKRQSTSRIDHCCLQTCFLVPTAVMARSLNFSAARNKKIRNFSGKVSSLYRNPEVITIENFRKLCSFIHSVSSGWNFEPALSAFIQVRQKHCDTRRQVISSFPLFSENEKRKKKRRKVFFSFSFFSRFYLIVRLFFWQRHEITGSGHYHFLQNAKFTSIVGFTSCRPTYIESFITIFGQCINVLNYKSCYLQIQSTFICRQWICSSSENKSLRFSTEKCM